MIEQERISYNYYSSKRNGLENGEETSSKISGSDLDKRDKILLQLHEQYAINNNSNLSSVVSLVVGLLVAFTGYGYVFLHTENRFFEGNQFMTMVCDSVGYEMLIVTTVVALAVVLLIFHICLHQGNAQRLEQFIIYAIRDEFGFHADNYPLPKEYHPYNKKGFPSMEYVQGLFGELTKVSMLAAVMLILLTAMKLFICSLACCVILGFLLFVFIIIFVYDQNHYYNRYKKRQDDYDHLNPKNDLE